MVDILLVPSVRRGNGSGHLQRCFSLARALGQRAAVYLPDDTDGTSWNSAELRLAYPRETASLRTIGVLSPEARFGLVVLDNRETSRRELCFWQRRGPVVAIDESGPARALAAYVIDILPRLAKGDEPNLSSLGFLSLPEARREPPKVLRRVLVSFGGEDPAGLAAGFLRAAVLGGAMAAEDVTVVSGALSETLGAISGVTAVGPVQDLKEKLRAYDLVVTQFGLTAFEAAWAGCAVLLCNPSRVHERLSREAGFRSLGIGAPSPRAVRAALADEAALIEASARAAPTERLDLAARLAALAPRHAGPCQACGSTDCAAVYRDERKTYAACPECGLVGMTHFAPRENPYAKEAYFFEEYKAQYGRTYIDDIPAIRKMAARRLAVIESLTDGRTVLDVGCAYGAFIAEAQSRGWNAVGSDLSPDAVEYVKKTFGAPAFTADFQSAGADGLYPRGLSCLSMWYVIEHFDELGRVLRRVGQLLAPGGVFAFSTPSGSGVSARRDGAAFLAASPDDHYTVWSPGTAKGILKRFGFEVQRIVVTGHHPERFPGVPDDTRSLRYRGALALSRRLGLGDTFECYAAYVGSGRASEAASAR